MKFAVIDRATSGEIVAAVSGKRIRVLSYLFSVATTTTVRFDSASTALTGAMTANAGVPFNAPQGPNTQQGAMGVLQTERGEAFNVTLGAAVQISGHLLYEETQ